jgi:MoxR-like ATPase
MCGSADWDRRLDGFRTDYEAICKEIAKRVVGQDEAIRAVATALVVGGHVLLEGLPGTGKSLLARTLADVLELSFQRVQCTPDLMPADVIGTYIVMETPQGRRTFEFRKGPLFANVVLADHVNRAAPRTQSALLEAMEAEAISVSTESFPLPCPFLIVATQNPLESDGTYPLPDAQIDRFLLHVVLPQPGVEQIGAILQRMIEAPCEGLRKVATAARILEMRELAREVPVPVDACHRAVSVVAATQPDCQQAPALVRQFVRYGAGARGAQAMVLSAQVHSAMSGRSAVAVDDLRAVAPAVLRHRLILNAEGVAEGVSPDAILRQVLDSAGRPEP